jgi:hypothetical protein
MDTLECPIELTNVEDHELHSWRLQKMDYVFTINDVGIKHVNKSPMNISLCPTYPMRMVRPIMDVVWICGIMSLLMVTQG